MTSTIRDTIDRLFDRIGALSEAGPGYTRPSYGALESRAHAVVADHAATLGLTVTRDAALNLFARLPGADRDAPPLHVGSHLDTVANGGAYDGVAGVVGAVALAADLVARGVRLPCDLVVTVTRAEESVWFPVSYVGSRAALGRLGADDLRARRSDSGRTLAEHLREEGGDPDAILRGPGLAPARFVEMHIEQGPVLDAAGEAFAVVDAVRGGLRYRDARIQGVWAHSGGAPRELRSDAVFGLADLVTAMDRGWARSLAEGGDLAVTFGRVDAATPEHAFAKVPGRLDFCVDLRSVDDGVLESTDALLRAEIAAIERARGLRFDLGPQSRSRPARMSPALVAALVGAARERGVSPRILASGGGHDAAAFALAGWDAAMIFLRNQNGSHNPDEAMDLGDLAEAVAVLAAAIPGIAATPRSAA
ncbi:hydantoinase/carbamoylase family amidase [Siculibacillus lacustris]|uniref:Hydantoinase/carbamoylase family amidase n=1 Tax=Siculibacillus lacustris TaxID=1549641 RepID=A0A4Q9VKD6_9HYPH|nr:hydantoinase/carbamoylase family amidase [Siculibacillus lacustris]TBW35365.1 hydantoinase/carbamoylase family amidase [Siculibacillus lacustris]